MEVYRSAGVAIISALMRPGHSGDDQPARCSSDRQISRRCEHAVVTAYRELRLSGDAEAAAFQTCTALYRIYHPEAATSEASRLVAEWIDHHILHENTGPTAGCDCVDE